MFFKILKRPFGVNSVEPFAANAAKTIPSQVSQECEKGVTTRKRVQNGQ